jgi:NADH-quinone oxidoreductase subunit C
VRTTAGDVGEGGAVPAGGEPQGFEHAVVQKLRMLPEAVIETSVLRPHRVIAKVRPEGVVEVCRLLRSFGFDHLSCVTCVDYDTELEMVYLLWSYKEKCLIELRAGISGTEPKIHSVTSIWTGAEFHEREAYDMFGVLFEGCPNLTRVLLPEEWTVFPLRKSFKVESLYSLHEKEKRLDAERAKAAKMQAAASIPPPPGAEKSAGEKGDNAPPRDVVLQKEGS